MSTERKFSDIKKGSEFLLKTPLYSKIKVSLEIETKIEREILGYNEEEIPDIAEHTYFYENKDFRYLKALICDEKRIYSYCPFCKKELILLHKGKEIPKEYESSVLCVESNINSELIYQQCEAYANEKLQERYDYLVKNLLDKNRNITIELECTSKSKHNIQIFFHLTEDNYLMKIGQYPSIVDFEDSNMIKYKKILNKYSKEYHRAIGLKAHGVGIGSFVYLRRIFEDLIYQKVNEKIEFDENFDKEQFIKLHINEKIEKLQDKLPCFLVDNNILYGILSKGIHELTEKECLLYFDYVKQAIEVILDENIEMIEKNKKKEEIKKSLNKINGKIKS